MKTSRILAALCATITCAATMANAAVKSSVFDDVKVCTFNSSGWVNYDWHKFTLVPAPQPLVFVVH